jgi:DNA processing protein
MRPVRSGEWPLGLAWLARELGRDLGRAARAAGGAGTLWPLDPAGLGRALRLGPDDLARALGARAAFDGEAERRRLAGAGIDHVGAPDARFPARLGEIYDPPFGLFLRGDVDGALASAAEGPCVAVVGSRRPTAAGLAFARDLARELAERGASVVSGLALGVDGAAHEGALAGGGVTLAVLGSGVDVVHPRRHRDLARRIAARGLLVSEYWPGTPPAPWRFPARNRLIAGVSQAVVVVEAGRRSGALITADFALEAGRPVLAVPGFPGSEAAAGCHALLRAGAGLCEGAEDVVAELPDAPWADVVAPPPPEPAGLPGRIYEALRTEPLRPDQLSAALGEEPAPVAAALARLEVQGHVLRGEGQRFWASPRRGA